MDGRKTERNGGKRVGKRGHPKRAEIFLAGQEQRAFILQEYIIIYSFEETVACSLFKIMCVLISHRVGDIAPKLGGDKSLTHTHPRCTHMWTSLRICP